MSGFSFSLPSFFLHRCLHAPSPHLFVCLTSPMLCRLPIPPYQMSRSSSSHFPFPFWASAVFPNRSVPIFLQSRLLDSISSACSVVLHLTIILPLEIRLTQLFRKVKSHLLVLLSLPFYFLKYRVMSATCQLLTCILSP